LKTSVDKIKNDPEHFIRIILENLRKDVDLRRECLKKEIDEYYEKIIKEIDLACKQKMESVEREIQTFFT
jgi:hypothetical protein